MDEILFPAQYKNAFLKKTKNTTIRVNKEVGKYKAGKTYIAKSYTGTNWNIKIKVEKIFSTTFKSLSKFGIPKRSIESLRKKEKLLPYTKVEVIRFVVQK